MNVLLVAINAKYIHSNPAIYSLKSACTNAHAVTLAEYTINHQREKVVADIYKQKPDVIAFSCYIWNIAFVEALIKDIALVLPKVPIWLGGPEVSYDAREALERLPMVKGVMVGEGEKTFDSLVSYYLEKEACLQEKKECITASFDQVQGIVWRYGDEVRDNGWPQPCNLRELPFYYEQLPEDAFENRIVYYESSRGCPFSCSYCLSSIDKQVRFRDIDLVKKELTFFLERKVPQVKFIDRTFNCDKSRAKEIWRFIKERANGITNFHFEVSADLLDEESLELLCSMPNGLMQLEIGVQTINEKTLKEIRRKTHLPQLFSSVERLIGAGTVHCHLDLIAGLPYEDFESFQKSFNEVYGTHPHQLQLGFLKVLKGSYMEEKAKEYGLKYSQTPPYEVLATNWITYGQLTRLKGIEEMVEVYANSGQFLLSLPAIIKCFQTPFAFFEALAQYYSDNEIMNLCHSRVKRYEILRAFFMTILKEKRTLTTDDFTKLLVLDLYARERVKSRPSWAADLTKYKEQIQAFYKKEAESPMYLKGYEGFDSQQLKRMTHLEPLGDGCGMLFDYKTRDAITYNGKMIKVENCFESLARKEKID